MDTLDKRITTGQRSRDFYCCGNDKSDGKQKLDNERQMCYNINNESSRLGRAPLKIGLVLENRSDSWEKFTGGYFLLLSLWLFLSLNIMYRSVATAHTQYSVRIIS